jgi:hypothetical protein
MPLAGFFLGDADAFSAGIKIGDAGASTGVCTRDCEL